MKTNVSCLGFISDLRTMKNYQVCLAGHYKRMRKKDHRKIQNISCRQIIFFKPKILNIYILYNVCGYYFIILFVRQLLIRKLKFRKSSSKSLFCFLKIKFLTMILILNVVVEYVQRQNKAPTSTERYVLLVLPSRRSTGIINFFCSICNVPNLDLEIADQCQYWLEGVILVSYGQEFFLKDYFCLIILDNCRNFRNTRKFPVNHNSERLQHAKFYF